MKSFASLFLQIFHVIFSPCNLLVGPLISFGAKFLLLASWLNPSWKGSVENETLPSYSPQTISRGTFACTIGSYTVAHTQAAVKLQKLANRMQIMNIFETSTHFAATSSVAWLQRYSRPLPHSPSHIPFLFYLSLCLRGDASLPDWLFQGPPWPSCIGMTTFLSMCKPMHVDFALIYTYSLYIHIWCPPPEVWKLSWDHWPFRDAPLSSTSWVWTPKPDSHTNSMLVTSQQIMSNRTWNRWTSSFDIVERTVLLDIQLDKVFIETKATIDLVCQKSQSGTLLADDLPRIPAGNDDGQLVSMPPFVPGVIVVEVRPYSTLREQKFFFSSS